MENVFMTTTERKRMSTKTTFKRIALVAVAVLGLGVFSVAPSKAAVTVGSETLTLSAATQTVAIGETATTTLTLNFTTLAASESVGVVVLGTGATGSNEPNGSGGGMLFGLKADSVNATMSSTDSAVVIGRSGGYEVPMVYATQATAGTVVQAKFRLDIQNASVAGTHVYSITTRAKDGTISKSATFTVTVTPKDTTPSKTYTKAYINDYKAPGSGTYGIYSQTAQGVLLESDSALVVKASSAAIFSSADAVGTYWVVAKNASDTKTVLGSDVLDSITVVITGPGSISTKNSTAKVKTLTMAYNETATIWNDGTPGVGTITAYIGSSASSTYQLAQAPKTITFGGKATTFTASAIDAVAKGGTLSYASADSIVAGIVTFVAKDASGNFVTDAGQNYNGNFYVISSDTSVIGAGVSASGVRSTDRYAACTLKTASTGTWTCSMDVRESGTATLTIADSFTVASSNYTSTAISYTVAGAARTGTIAFDKSTYAPGEKAILTITSKDRAGRVVPNGASNPFTSIIQSTPFSSADATYGFGGSSSGTSWTMTGSTFVNGVETVVVYMPTYTTTVKFTGYTDYDSSTQNTAINVSAAVVDPTKDAADAATDAALEATDAAYAAQDAAQLAAEAADAATAAAEAATAAVEDLATQVASLFADLQKQITTLANVVAKIAKKVKA